MWVVNATLFPSLVLSFVRESRRWELLQGHQSWNLQDHKVVQRKFPVSTFHKNETLIMSQCLKFMIPFTLLTDWNMSNVKQGVCTLCVCVRAGCTHCCRDFSSTTFVTDRRKRCQRQADECVLRLYTYKCWLTDRYRRSRAPTWNKRWQKGACVVFRIQTAQLYFYLGVPVKCTSLNAMQGLLVQTGIKKLNLLFLWAILESFLNQCTSAIFGKLVNFHQ